MCLPAQQTRRHWTHLCDFDRSHQRQRRWRPSPCWSPSRGGSRVGPYLPPGISLVHMSATESASQKGTKAGTKTRPGDLERERVVRYSYLSWRFFLQRYHKYYNEKANLAKFYSHWFSKDCSFVIILTYHWEICVDCFITKCYQIWSILAEFVQNTKTTQL